ncbi:NUDIX domain-containing protein [Limibaculum sp. FT325]|uniref:NUDIX domain-containing protein n=1 Tax=Thermohalobaculum sediminis TaxID=2939436 RepID=UPI0020C05025|nr:NUDIX domain-containing protein [Limibaculum sediminis]MCL5777427.1 NUDIX domain-containing protein [Limibaculum sediminis]
MKPIFLYGSLRDRGLLEVVLGRPLGPACILPARAEGFVALRHARADYPLLWPAPGAAAEGTLFRPAGPAERARLEFYESAEYELAGIEVLTASGLVAADYFRPREGAPASAEPWDLAAWQAEHAALVIEAARELMEHHGRLPPGALHRHWPAMLTRARARVLAAQGGAVAGDALRTGFSAARDVEWLERRPAWTGYLAVEEHRLRHRRHDGGWTQPLARTTVSWGDAVTILPYDPRRDRVLMIEQFRPGPAARGDPTPWCIEVIAGRIDADGNSEATARREAMEEAGLTIGRIIRLPGYYPTPGLASEYLAAFVGEADLAGEGGLHGLAAEGEDIRTIVLPLDAALDALESGGVNTGPAMIPLLWLARHRERLRAAWA